MSRQAIESSDRRILRQAELSELRERYGSQRIVLATGCFDLVHKGHIYFLKQAARQGDLLVVGVNSDESVRGLKGPNRPIVAAIDRCAVLAEFACVDYVFTYDEPCAGESIRLLRPDVFAVGAESVGHYPDEINAARAANARIYEISKTNSTSTTGMIDLIKDRMSEPLVSVIYVNWNTKALLEASMTSLRQHADDSARLEIVVVDNGSSDGTVEWLRRECPEVMLVTLDRNVGFTVGNNKGVEHATGEYLLLLNTDTIVLPTTVSGLTRVLEANPHVACVGARHLNADGSLQRSMDSFPNIEADFLTLTELHRVNWVARVLSRRHAWWSEHGEYREVDWVNGACMMIRRRAFKNVGGFDPGFFIFGDELDLCYRLRETGWKVVFTPDAEIIHLGGAAMDHVAVRRLYLKHEGLLRFYDKHKSFLSRIAIRIILISTICCRAVALLIAQMLPRGSSAYKRCFAIVTQLRADASLSDAFRAWRRIGFAALKFHGSNVGPP